MLLTFASSSGVEIYESSIPPPIEFGQLDEVVLNCNYDISESEYGQLDVKWFFQDSVVPFLQWIPGGKVFHLRPFLILILI